MFSKTVSLMPVNFTRKVQNLSKNILSCHSSFIQVTLTSCVPTVPQNVSLAGLASKLFFDLMIFHVPTITELCMFVMTLLQVCLSIATDTMISKKFGHYIKCKINQNAIFEPI